MKKVKYILSVLLIITGTFSCEEYLDEVVISGITASSHYTSVEGLEDGVKAAYEPLRSLYGTERGAGLTVFGTDEYERGWSGGIGGLSDYTGNMVPTDQSFSDLWDAFYRGINICNAVLFYAEDLPSFSEERIGEVRFLRAFYYWVLVEQFGDIHLTTEYTADVETEAVRSSEETVYNDLIIPDLEFAIQNLSPSSSEYGRINKGIAEAFMAKVQLTVGWKKELYGFSGSSSENWTRTLQLAENVLNNYNYSLMNDFAEVWDFFNQENNEVIWPIQYSQNPLINGNGNQLHLFFLARYDVIAGMQRDVTNGRPFRRFRPTEWMLTLYDETIDSRYEKTFTSTWFCNNLSNAPDGMQIGDTALYIVNYPVDDAIQESKPYVLLDMEARDYEGAGKIDGNFFPSNKKFSDPFRPGTQEARGSRDFFAIRLAEIYLIAAEAAHMAGDNMASAQFINTIRRRAARPGMESAIEINAADIDIDFILDERSRELCGEQMRWFDLKRTGKLIERHRAYNRGTFPDPNAIQSFHIYRPIPQTQIDRLSNAQEFPQNDGYQ